MKEEFSVRLTSEQKRYLHNLSKKLPPPHFGRLGAAFRFIIDEDMKRSKAAVKTASKVA